MLCKWCGENDVKEGARCGFCGTYFGEERPRVKKEQEKVAVSKKKKEK